MECVRCATRAETLHRVKFMLIQCFKSNMKPDAEELAL